MNRLGASALVAAIILVFGRLPTFASEAAIRENEINPWRNKNGSLVDGAVLMSPGGAGRPSSGPASARNAGLAEETGKPLRVVLPANLPMAGVASAFEQGEEIGIEPAALYEMPREEYNTYAGGDPRALNDRGIDYADTKWRRQARITGIRMRMLNGPELAVAYDGISTNLEQGSRTSAGAVAPINTRWEMAAINNFTAYESKPTGAEAALDAVTIRLNGNPSVSKRPWAAITPFAGMRDGRGRGIGVSAGYSWNFSGGIGLDLEGYAWRPWDESYDTIIQDGRQHGLAAGLTLPVDRRLTFVAGVDIEWLELGPRAAAGRQSAGHQGGWNVRGNYVIWRRDGALMGYGFRDETLWNEQLIPVELGIFADMNWRRYVAPEDFTVIAPTRKSLQQRVGLFYYQAITPHLGFNSEAYLGRDPRRGIGPGKIYGVNLRLTAAVNSHFRFWTGWGYEKNRNDLTAGGGDAGGSNPASVWSFGLNCNF